MRRILLVFATLSILVLGACSSAPERADKQVTETDDPLNLDAPTPEKLADSPCGNPDWSKLPPSMPKEKTNP